MYQYKLKIISKKIFALTSSFNADTILSDEKGSYTTNPSTSLTEIYSYIICFKKSILIISAFYRYQLFCKFTLLLKLLELISYSLSFPFLVR